MMLDRARLTVQLQMAVPHGVEVPKDNPDITLLDSLRPLKGKQFDQAYIQKVGLKGHKQAVAAFEREMPRAGTRSSRKRLEGAANHQGALQDGAGSRGEEGRGRAMKVGTTQTR
jgi:predicted outer membrane protein